MSRSVGYMPPENGPFKCANCRHYQDTAKGSGCNDKEVIADLGAGKNGLAAVAPEGCCNEFQPKQKRSGFGAKLVRIA